MNRYTTHRTMNKNLLNLAFLAALYGVSGNVIAYDNTVNLNVTGNSETVTIDQTSSHNDTINYTLGSGYGANNNNTDTISQQNSSYDTATVTQGNNTGGTADFNQATIDQQYSDHNAATINQGANAWSSSRSNTATINQLYSNYNTATINQAASNGATVTNSTASIDQSNSTNTNSIATINQGASGSLSQNDSATSMPVRQPTMPPLTKALGDTLTITTAPALTKAILAMKLPLSRRMVWPTRPR